MCAFGFVGLSIFQRTRFELHREVSKKDNTLFSSSSPSLEVDFKTVSMRGPGRRDTSYLSDLDETWSD